MTFLSPPRDRTDAPDLPYAEFVAMIALLMALNAAAIDVYIPALSDIGSALGVAEANRRQFVITAYIIGFGAAQIVYGPLSDRFGRRHVLFAGLGIYIAGAIAGSSCRPSRRSSSRGWCRGSARQRRGWSPRRWCATGFTAQMARVMSLVMMVFMVMPVFAPNLGSLVLAFGD